jgi:hypothetical protein
MKVKTKMFIRLFAGLTIAALIANALNIFYPDWNVAAGLATMVLVGCTFGGMAVIAETEGWVE